MEIFLIKNIKLITLFMLISASFIFLSSCVRKQIPPKIQEEAQIESVEFCDIKFENIIKIGIIPQMSNKKKRDYIQKNEILVSEKATLSKFAVIASKGEYELVYTDRLPSEYILNLYFENGKRLKAYYCAYFGSIRTLIPGISGQRFGIIRTPFRHIRTPCRVNKTTGTL